MTNNQELIAELRAYASEEVAPQYDDDGDLILDYQYLDGVNGARRDVLRILDRHAALTPRVVSTVEGEWEYAVVLAKGTWVDAARFPSEEAARSSCHEYASGDASVVRRRKPGAWEPVEQPNAPEHSLDHMFGDVSAQLAALTIRREGDSHG